MKYKYTIVASLLVMLTLTLSSLSLAQTAQSKSESKQHGATMAFESELTAQQQMLWDALREQQFDTYASLLSSEYLDAEPNGIFDKAAAIDRVKSTELSNAGVDEFKVVKVSNDTAVVTYVDNAGSEERVRRSTVWVKRSGKWLIVFHQRTPLS